MFVSIFDIISNISISGWAILLGSILTMMLSGVIFWQDLAKRSSRFFFIFSVTVLAWGSSFVFFRASIGTSFVHTGLIIFYLIAGLVAPTLFFMLDAFSGSSATQRPLLKLALVFGPYILLALGFLVPGFIVGYDQALNSGRGGIAFGGLFVPYVLYSVLLFALGFGLLIKKYRESAGMFRLEMRAFVITFAVTALITLAGTLFYPIFTHTQDLFCLGYIGGALLFLVITGLIIIKYDFLSFKVIATELFISIIVLILIAELFLANSLIDLFVKMGITILVVFSSSFLVESVKREIQSRDKIAHLLRDLDLMFKRLKVLDRKKSEFLSVASHHLRDPLTAIKGYASMLVEGSFGELSQPVKEAVEKIFISSEHLIMMVSDFLDISRIESGDMNYNFADVDMKKLVVDIVDGMKQSATHSHLALYLTIEDGDDASFITTGDEGKLRQVISNLIDNSIKYTPKGEIQTCLSKSSNGKKIIFSLSDTGIGMSPSTLDKIFKKFSRAEGVSKVYTEGTGLGLYVAKEIIKKHEGRIWAKSDGEGTGSSFYVELDAKQ